MYWKDRVFTVKQPLSTQKTKIILADGSTILLLWFMNTGICLVQRKGSFYSQTFFVLIFFLYF